MSLTPTSLLCVPGELVQYLPPKDKTPVSMGAECLLFLELLVGAAWCIVALSCAHCELDTEHQCAALVTGHASTCT